MKEEGATATDNRAHRANPHDYPMARLLVSENVQEHLVSIHQRGVP